MAQKKRNEVSYQYQTSEVFETSEVSENPSKGLQIPDSLVDLKAGDQVIQGSNLLKTARYDQILHLPSLKKRFTNHCGTLDFYPGEAFIKQLFPKQNYTREKFTDQLSDYFPVWVQIDTDIDGERLDQIVQPSRVGSRRPLGN
jgi:hypothetical protein